VHLSTLLDQVSENVYGTGWNKGAERGRLTVWGAHKVQAHTSGKISYLKLCVAMETSISSPGVPLPPFITGSCVNALSWKKEVRASRGATGRRANN